MKQLTVGAAALNQTPLDWKGNKRRIFEAIRIAKEEGVGILCFPELAVSGYGCEDAFLSPNTRAHSLDILQECLPLTADIALALGLPLQHGRDTYNTVAFVADGQISGFVAKHSLAGTGVYYEPRWFRSWPLGKADVISIGDTSIPFGDIYFDLEGTRIGFEICEDAWTECRRAQFFAEYGVHVVLNPSASHFAFGKYEVRKNIATAGSDLCKAVYVYCNHVGNDAGRIIYDGGAIVAQDGQIIALGPRFSFKEVALTALTVTLEERSGSDRSAEDGRSPQKISVPFSLPTCSKTLPLEDTSAWEKSGALKAEEFARAVSLGLFDYVRKSRSRGLVISLSGGADSSAVACLVRLMVDLGIAELGLSGFLSRFDFWNELQTRQTKEEIVSQLLTCVYQATENSSATTRAAAAGVAKEIGAQFLEFDIQPIVNDYLRLVSNNLEGFTAGKNLTWEGNDLALQNIQARVRAPAVWLVANLLGALLVTTSNRSEAAVGYTTMDGDTAGGISPIGGIDKAYLRIWLKWLEAEGVEGKWNFPSLSLVNSQAPTAELRPPAAKQTDEQDLMPYVVLDRIERYAIRDRMSPLEVFYSLTQEVGEYTSLQLGQWVERFFLLWSKSQWKRERYAPSFHLDDENLDPKSWCRFPILSGGFELELEELREVLHGDGRSE